MFIVTSLCVCHPHWTLLLYYYCTSTVLLLYYCTTIVGAEKLQLYLAFKRSSTLIHGKDCAWRRKCTTLPRLLPSTTPIHGKGCARRRHDGKNVQLYLAFLRWTTPIHRKGCASRRTSATLPHVPAFDHANPWERLRVALTGWKKCATLPRDRVFDHANPWERLRVTPKMCNLTSRSCVRPRQSMGRVARHADMLEKMCNFTSRSCV